MSVSGQTERHDRRTTAMISSFESRLGAVLSRAQARVLSSLRDQLVLQDGLVQPTPGNVRVVSQVGKLFVQAMAEEGYEELLTRFLREFDGQLTIFEKILEDVSKGFKIKAQFSERDFNFFDRVKVATGAMLEDVVAHVGQVARQRALFTLNGLEFSKLATLLAERLHVTQAEATTLAATGVSTFYRTIADAGYQRIENELEGSGTEIQYTYVGPPATDKLIRPFCSRLMQKAAAGQTWTRKQITAMNNGQLPNVFATGGGYNCRHQWVIALEGDTI